MTVHVCAGAAERILVAAGFPPDDARRDAGVLGRHVLGWTHAEWAVRLHKKAPPQFHEHLIGLATRRASREPVAYITGTREFYGRPFCVTPDVLIPRPETEGVIEAALAVDMAPLVPLVVDIGTGSGCIAVTLALEWPLARVVATDVSAAALAVAQENAHALGADRIEFIQVGPTDFLPRDFRGVDLVDLISSNPPYVPERDRSSLSSDVRDFEPASALFAGDDGLDVIRALLPAASRALKMGGVLAMEFGAGQREAVVELAERSGLAVEAVRTDLQGIPRVLVARRCPA